MSTRTLSSTPSPAVPLAPGTEKLIRKLVAQASQARQSTQPPASGQKPSDVLFTGEVDGVRCVLVRMPVDERTFPSLSPREREIARMIAEGHPNKTIAGVLEISVWTVGTHLRRIFSKLRVTSRAAMVARIKDSEMLS